MREFYLLLGLYALAGTGVSVAVMRANRSERDFFIGGGAIGWVVSAMTYAATTYSAFMMVGLVGLSYASGIGALIFEMVYLVATIILLSVYGGKIWELARAGGYISPMELFAGRYGARTARAGTVVAALALIPYTAVQVIGLAVILEGYGVVFTHGVVFAVAIIALWSLLGGLRGVALTDAIQGVLMLSIAVGALIWVGDAFPGVELSTFPNRIWTPAFFVNLTLPWSFFALTNPQVMQRLFILRSRHDLRKMIILFAVFGAAYTVITTVVGFSAAAGTTAGLFPAVADRDRVIVELMAMMGRALSLPLALSIVFASVSTANSILLTLASMVTREMKSAAPRPWMGRVVVALLSVATGFFALTRPAALVELSVASSRILMVFLPLLFGIFHTKRGGEWSGLLTIIGGFLGALLLGVLVPQHSSILTLIAVTLLYSAGLIIDRRKPIIEQ